MYSPHHRREQRWASVVAIFSVELSLLWVTLPMAIAQEIQWLTVLDTAHPSLMEPEPTPAMVGYNTIIRRGDAITFDASAAGSYVRYSGNCRTQVLYRLQVGGFNQAFQPNNVAPYENERWFAANDYQSKILATACAL